MLTVTTATETKTRFDRGLQRLAGAVLIQALQDASRGPRRAREEAIEWIFGPSQGQFSFELCCDLVGRAPEDVRQRLLRFPRPAPSAAPYTQAA